MPVQLTLPVEDRIFLKLPEEEDQKENLTYVDIRQASQRDVERRASLGEEVVNIYKKDKDDETVEQRRRFNGEEAKRLEVFLTLVGCNIESPESTPEKPSFLFKFRKVGKTNSLSMSEREFNEAWGNLPEHWATAIHEAVLQINPQWHPNYQG